jgi:hypothetical protein
MTLMAMKPRADTSSAVQLGNQFVRLMHLCARREQPKMPTEHGIELCSAAMWENGDGDMAIRQKSVLAFLTRIPQRMTPAHSAPRSIKRHSEGCPAQSTFPPDFSSFTLDPHVT